MGENLVNVIDPDTQQVGSIPASQLQDAVSQGYQPASQEQAQQFVDQQKFSSTGEQVKTGLEGAASAATFGASTAVEKALGVNPEDIQKRRAVNPGVHMVGQGLGLLATGPLGEAGAANILSKTGRTAAEAVGLGTEGAGVLNKIGSSAVEAAVENMAFQAGDEASKAFASDPNQSIETAATDIGLAGLIGAPMGAGFGATGALWKATMGGKVAGILKAISDRAGGIDGVVPEALQEAFQKSGVEVPAEMRAALSNNPELQQMFKTLQQSDTTKAGLSLQETYNNFKKSLGDSALSSFGKTSEEINSLENLSKYEAGKNLGETLSKEFGAQVDPLAEKFEKLKSKYEGVELPSDRSIYKNNNNPYLTAEEVNNEAAKEMLPGTATQIQQKLSELVQREGWYTSPSSDIMKEVRRVIDESKNLRTLKDLGNYQTQIGNNTYDVMNPQLSRAGQMMKSIVRDAESEIVLSKLGHDAPQLVGEYAEARSAYKKLADLKDQLDSRLHVKGGKSPTSFVKSLKEMSQMDGEKVLNRLSGKNSADLLSLLREQFPETFNAVRDYHVSELLKNAVSKAAPGESIHVDQLLKNIEKMSPELRDAILPADQMQKLQSIGTIANEFKKLPHNMSNTARTWDKLSQYLPGSAVAMGTMLFGHNPVASVLMGALVKPLGKDVPDAVRLGLLKFLGSSKPIEASGFKTMVDLIDHTIKGESIINKSAKNLFKAGQEVIPQALMPTEKRKEKLEKALKEYQSDPMKLTGVGGSAGHYLPDHGTALAQTSMNAVNYLNSLRPTADKKLPLDSEMKPSKSQQAAYDRALTIAEQPLMVLNHIKEGTLTMQDVKTLNTLYPQLHQKLIMKMTDEMTNHLSKDGTIPYKMRIGMSLFMGQPLDSTMTPDAIRMNQAALMMPQGSPQQQQGMPGQRAKHSMTALNKLAGSFSTAGQAREASRLK